MTDEAILQMVVENREQIQDAVNEEVNEATENTPTAGEMRESLRRIRIGLERRGVRDFNVIYRLEYLIDNTIGHSATQSSLDMWLVNSSQ